MQTYNYLEPTDNEELKEGHNWVFEVCDARQSQSQRNHISGGHTSFQPNSIENSGKKRQPVEFQA